MVQRVAYAFLCLLAHAHLNNSKDDDDDDVADDVHCPIAAPAFLEPAANSADEETGGEDDDDANYCKLPNKFSTPAGASSDLPKGLTNTPTNNNRCIYVHMCHISLYINIYIYI